MSTKKIRFQSWPVGKLKPAKDNPREHSAEQVGQIAASIKEFGFLAPIVVDARGEVLAGHGRLMAAKRLRMKQVPVAVDAELTAEQRAAYRIADNLLAGQSTWNKSKLRKAIDRLKASGFDFASIEQPLIDGQLNDDDVREQMQAIIKRSGAKAPASDDDDDSRLDGGDGQTGTLGVVLTIEQRQYVIDAINARKTGKMKMGDALHAICLEWMRAHKNGRRHANKQGLTG